MTEVERLARRADELRSAFDRSFSAPPLLGTQRFDDLLAIRIGVDPYCIRLSEIAAVVARRPIVGTPSSAPGLLGIAGIRGEIVPVFSLAFFLGYGVDPEPPAWKVLARGGTPIGLAFSELDGYVRLAAAAVHLDEHRHASRPFVTELASTEAGTRSIISISEIVGRIGERHRSQSAEEP